MMTCFTSLIVPVSTLASMAKAFWMLAGKLAKAAVPNIVFVELTKKSRRVVSISLFFYSGAQCTLQAAGGCGFVVELSLSSLQALSKTLRLVTKISKKFRIVLSMK